MTTFEDENANLCARSDNCHGSNDNVDALKRQLMIAVNRDVLPKSCREVDENALLGVFYT